MSEQVAIIRNVRIGCGDRGVPCMWFTVYISESAAASQVLSWDEAFEVLKAVEDVRDLEGKPCWVEADNHMIRFQRLWSK